MQESRRGKSTDDLICIGTSKNSAIQRIHNAKHHLQMKKNLLAKFDARKYTIISVTIKSNFLIDFTYHKEFVVLKKKLFTFLRV